MEKWIQRWGWLAGTVFARVALSAAFLSAVADRFGLWGRLGTGNVGWGDLAHYEAYVHTLAPYLSDGLVGVAGWGATLTELTLGSALLLGVLPRWSAVVAAATLMVFGLSMFFFSGFEAPLSASVFSAAAAALLLSLAPGRSLVFCAIPTLRKDRRQGTSVAAPGN
jgi:uncharacterized membrane protein YphA (DoxX/SURF4 family)